MATTTVNGLVDKAEIILQDTTNVRWAVTELIGWLNDGQRKIVGIKPEASVTNASVVLISGTKQAIPDAGIQLIDITRNMGATPGTTAGNAITNVARQVLDEQVPGWHSETATKVVKHYVFDERNPRVFYVYPQSDGTNYIEIIYSSAPTDCEVDGVITIDDIYANPLLDYVLYRAYLKDAGYTANSARATFHLQACSIALGERMVGEDLVEPVPTTGE